MLSPELLKPEIPISRLTLWGVGHWRKIFDAESRNTKIPNSHFWGGWVWGRGLAANF